MEGTGKGDDLKAVFLPLGPEIVPRRLDGAFEGLGTRIGEKHRVGESGFDQPLSQPLLLGNGEGIGGVPDLFGSGLECTHQMGIAMTKRIDGNARMKVEIVLPMLVKQAHAFAAFEREFGTSVGAIERRHWAPLSVMGDGTRNVAKLPQKSKTRPSGSAFSEKK